jgi:hypothetical protein
VIEFHNVNVDRKTALVNRAVANLSAALVRVPLGDLLLNALPDRLIYQRCYRPLMAYKFALASGTVTRF